MLITLPITILAYEGPCVRSYLTHLARANFQPESILLMVNSHDTSTGKPIGKWLPESLRIKYAEKNQEMSHNFWPRSLRKKYPDLYQSITTEISKQTGVPTEIFEENLGRFDYQNYTKSFSRILVENLKDKALYKSLSQLNQKKVLFTGGGIVPESILEIPDLKIIHIHPGILPAIKGADGILWSTLVKGNPGASCFFMKPGIDTGDIISTQDFPALRFPIPGKRPDDQTLYRAIFSYYDPILRAQFLLQVLKENPDIQSLSAKTQNIDEGNTYHFMHPNFRREALRLIFPES